MKEPPSAMRDINSFVDHCWRMAKEQLNLLDPSYVAAFESAKTGKESWLPAHPATRLSKKWVGLLEASWDVLWQVDVLWCSVQLQEPKRYRGRDVETIGREAHYHLVNWFHNAYALIEKVELLMNRALQVTMPDAGGAQRKRFLAKHMKALRNVVKQPLDTIRSPLVHGAGGKGPWISGITDIQMWEPAVALQMPIDSVLPNTYRSGGANLTARHATVTRGTNGFLARIGEVLSALQLEIE